MIERVPMFMALATASAMAQAHDKLALDSSFHRLLHAVGTERLVVLGGTLLAIVVGLIVRRGARKTARHRRSAG